MVNIDASGNVYRTDADSTVPGKMNCVVYDNSTTANSEFSFIADTMAPEGKRFHSTLWIHQKRDSYYEILGRIGGKKYK
jgi:hypothetical protein